MRGDEFLKSLSGLEGVEESPSAFKEGPALWVNGKEIAHLDGSDVLDVRLGRGVIKELRPQLRANERVRFRRSTSDWIEIELGGDEDWIVDLFAQAVLAHQAPAGALPSPPPTGAELDRRRRFH